MSLLDRLERILGRLAVPNMSLFIVIGQAFVVLATMLKLLDPERLLYAPVLFLHGQWWGIVTFLIYKVPPQGSGLELGYVWLVFAWYLLGRISVQRVFVSVVGADGGVCVRDAGVRRHQFLHHDVGVPGVRVSEP